MDKSGQVATLYLLTHLGLIFFMYPTDIIESLSAGHWSAIVLGFTLHLVVIYIYLKGLSYFDSKNVIDIFGRLGKVFSVVLLLPVAIYILNILILTVRAYSEIIKLIFLARTPLWAIVALLVLVSMYLASLGVESIFRTGILIAVLFLPFLFVAFFLSFQNADWRYVFPLMDKQAASFAYVFQKPFLSSLFAFTGGFMFLGFIPPYISFKRSAIFKASFLLLPFFLISVYAPLLTFGRDTAAHLQFPYIMVVDTVDISWLIFDRITMFFMISLIGFILLYLSVCFWKVSLLMRRGFPFIKPIPAKLILSLVVFIICMQIPDWETVIRLFWWNTFPRLYVMTVIPLMTLYLGIRSQGKGATKT